MDNTDSTAPQINPETPPETPERTDSNTVIPDAVTPTKEVAAEIPENLSVETSTPAAIPDNTTPPPDAAMSNEPAATTVSPQPPSTPPTKSRKLLVLVIILVLIGLAGVGATGYILGSSKNKIPKPISSNSTSAVPDKELTIPPGATVIAQCAKGRGTQYALPKDIPLGPVYNVSEGRVIGIEFMVGKDDLLVGAKSYLNLPLSDIKYDHVNIGLLSQGHAGFPTPHYHVDVMMVSTSVTDKITCT